MQVTNAQIRTTFLDEHEWNTHLDHGRDRCTREVEQRLDIHVVCRQNQFEQSLLRDLANARIQIAIEEAVQEREVSVRHFTGGRCSPVVST